MVLSVLIASLVVWAQGEEAFRLSWRFVTGGRIASKPAVDHRGMIYFASDDRYLYALDPSGAERWRFPLGSKPSSSPVIAYDGTLLVGTAGGKLWAVGPNGRLRWSFAAPAGPCLSPALGRDGTIYLPAGSGTLFALSYRGRQLWRYQIKAEITSSPVIGPDDTLYIASSDRRLLALEATGEKKWELPLPGRVGSPAIAADGILYVAASGLHAISPQGAVLWSYPIPAPTADPVLRPDGSLIAGAGNGKFYAVSAAGEKLWDLRLDAPVRYAALAADDGAIYAATEGDSLYALSAAGKVLRSFRAKQAVQQFSLGRDGSLYAGSDDWILYRLQTPASGPALSPWPMAFHDSQHTGRSGGLENLEHPAALILRELAFSESSELKQQALGDIEKYLRGDRFLPLHLQTLEEVLGYLTAEGVTIRKYTSGVPSPGYPAVRQRACGLLGALESEGARDILLDVVRRDEVLSVRIAALEALGEIGMDPDGELAALLSWEARTGTDERLLLAGLETLFRILQGSPAPAGPEAYRVMGELARGEHSRRVRRRASELLSELAERTLEERRRLQ